MSHLPTLIADLALILGAGAVVSVICKILKQPVVLGYILAGLFVGPNFRFFPSVADIESVQVWAEIGVIFLLFSLGLEFSFRKLASVGGSASVTGVFEVAVMLLLGYGVGQVLGWSEMDSLFLGGILSISSTTIILRAFEELGYKSRGSTSLVFGVLIVEDLVAILLLVLLATVAASRQFQGAALALSFFRLTFFLILWFVLGIFALPSLLRKLRPWLSEELLLVFSLGMCLAMVMLATSVGFSPALGAFIMGSLLAETSEGPRIEHALQPIRSLFGVVFFVSVGMLIDPSILKEHALAVLIVTAVTIVGKIVSTAAGALVAGQSLRYSIQAGFSLAQIGEFSFIIATLGNTLGVTSKFLYPIAVAVSVLTTFITPYLIRMADPVYLQLEKILPATVKDGISRYTAATQRISGDRVWRTFALNQLITIAINSTLVIALTGVGIQFLRPWLLTELKSESYSTAITLAATILANAPFLWAIAFGLSQDNTPEPIHDNSAYKLPILIIRILRPLFSLLLLTLVTFRFVPFWTAIAVMVATFFISLLASRGLKKAYLRFREHFLSNLAAQPHPARPATAPPQLAPWDAHIVPIEIEPESPFVGQSLIDLKIREKYGVTIALIERGQKRITAPGRDERLYPHDKAFVIGTDDQLARFKSALEPTRTDQIETTASYRLHSMIIPEYSTLVSKTIRNSGLRENISGLVVGIERDGDRFLNPDSSMVLKAGDLLWVVGDPTKFKHLVR